MQRSAGDRDVSSTLTSVPYPYENGMAEEWIRFCYDSFEKGKGVHFALALITDKSFIGTISLEKLDRKHEKGELGYWLGKSYWNRGYATEAARTVVAYGFEVLKLNRIYSSYYTRNPASGRVLAKIGMRIEGYLRQDVNYPSLKTWACNRIKQQKLLGVLPARNLFCFVFVSRFIEGGNPPLSTKGSSCP